MSSCLRTFNGVRSTRINLFCHKYSQINVKRRCYSGHSPDARIGGCSSNANLNFRAAVPVTSERNGSCSRLNTQQKAVQHLRRLATFARKISDTSARLAKACFFGAILLLITDYHKLLVKIRQRRAVVAEKCLLPQWYVLQELEVAKWVAIVLQAKTPEVRALLALVGLTPKASRLSAASVDALGPTGLADLIWALGALGEFSHFEKEMDAVLEIVDFQQQDFKIKDLADIAWSLATATHWTPKLADLATSLSLRGGLTAVPQNFHLSSFLWSFAILDFSPPDMFSGVLPPNRMASINPDNLINTCWCLCVLQEMQSDMFKAFWKELGTRDLTNLLLTDSLVGKLAQINMSMNQEEGAVVVSATHAKLLEEAHRSWRHNLLTADFHMSAQHADTCRALKSMGVKTVIEDVSSGYAVDIAIPELRIAIEIDGRTHFARNFERRLGPSAMKHRHLRQRGWHVFALVADDWVSAESSHEALQDLRDLISYARRYPVQQRDQHQRSTL